MVVGLKHAGIGRLGGMDCCAPPKEKSKACRLGAQIVSEGATSHPGTHGCFWGSAPRKPCRARSFHISYRARSLSPLNCPFIPHLPQQPLHSDDILRLAKGKNNRTSSPLSASLNHIWDRPIALYRCTVDHPRFQSRASGSTALPRARFRQAQACPQSPSFRNEQVIDKRPLS